MPSYKSLGNAQFVKSLDTLYTRCNKRSYIHPDPLEFVYKYADPEDREVVGLISACLAYGRVAQILKSIESVLGVLAKSPHRTLREADEGWLRSEFKGFQHRWTTGAELASLLYGVGRLVERHGSLQKCFLEHQPENAETTLPGLTGFVRELREVGGGAPSSLISSPEKGSACKRLHLYLRWMVRQDRVDPGCWADVSPRLLIVPLDTHIHRMGRSLGMTDRKQANLRAALEVTRAFRKIAPDDPVRYDFALTRLGIRGEMEPETFLEECGLGG